MATVKNKSVSAVAGAMAGAGAMVTEMIQGKWEECIGMFYGAYSPHRYQRTGNTYTASDRGANNYVAVNGNTVEVQAGIIVDPAFMAGTYMNDDNATVFGNTYSAGIHGNPKVAVTDPPQGEFEPWFNAMQPVFVEMILAAI